MIEDAQPQAGALSMLACALGAAQLRVSQAQSASRWRGRLGTAQALAVGGSTAVESMAVAGMHRHARLQVLRRVLDLQPGGRWAIEPALRQALSDTPHPVLLRRLFLWVDGTRVDALLPSRFPGAADDLALDPPPSLPTMLAARCASLPPPADAWESLQIAIELHRALLAMRGTRRAGPAMLDVSRVRLREDLPTLPSGSDGQRAGSEPMPDPNPGRQGLRGQGDHRPSPRPWARQQAPAAAASTRASGGTADGGDVIASPPSGPTQAEAPSAHHPHGLRFRPGAAKRQGSLTRHDEWDRHLKAYRRAWTAVHERRLQGSDLGWLDGLRERFPSLSQQIRRRFSRVSMDGLVRERRMTDGDRFDLDAVVDALVARRMGARPMDDRLYQSTSRRTREVSLALLLDMSGSTGYRLPPKPGTNGPPAAADAPKDDEPFWQMAWSRTPVDTTPARRVIDVARDAVGLLCDALHALGDRHAVFAFSGDGREHVDFAVVKDFADPWSPQMGAALAAVQPQGSTRTGAAVRHALRHLRAEPARRKMLVVLSDGYPQDRDYGPDPDDTRYGLEDTANALREAERAGVSTFNISVDAAANDYLRRMCPLNRYWVVDDVDDLPAKMLALYRLMAVSS